MKAIVFDQPGDENVLRVGEIERPAVGAGEIRIRIRSTSVNRADLLQRQGLYPPPPGASPVLGLECAGDVIEIGPGAEGWKIGDRVMALLAGGGYAEQASVHGGSAMRIPGVFSEEEAGSFCEVFLTAFLNIFQLGAVPAGGSVLVHGGGSGVGTAAMRLCKEAGVRIIVTAGSEAKCQRCRSLGADYTINYNDGDFSTEVREATAGKGVDVVLDCIGGRYLAPNQKSLAIDGRLVIIGLMGGARAEIDLAGLLVRRQQVIGSTLRSRSAAEKAAIVRGFLERFGAALEAGRLRPIVDRVLPLSRAADAHRAMAKSEHFGKIALRVEQGAE